MRRGQNRSRRRGNVLVYFAMIAFVFFTMAALTIDMGFVRLTQAQMQPAVEAAALEGLRFRDHLPDPWLSDPVFLAAVTPESGPRPPLPQYLTDPVWVAWRDNVRRWMARNQASLVYANQLSPGNDNPFQPSIGAGPIYAFNGGLGDSNAFEMVTKPTPPMPSVYQPILQLNLVNRGMGNVQQGDMVAGTFGNNPNYPINDASEENSSYDRRDFIAAPASSASIAPSFLVRLRRINDFQTQSGVDNQAGVSSSGPQMPLLFGRGSLIAGGDPNTGYSPRHHGLTVRATAIADARPVVSVGKFSPSMSLPGGAPFVFFFTQWGDAMVLPNDDTDANSATANQPVQITINGTGTLTINGTQVGYFTSTNPTPLISLGQPTTALTTDPTPAQLTNALTDPIYVPIIEDPGSAIGGTIIGFGFLTVDLSTITSMGFQIRKRTGKIASLNATTVLMQPLPSMLSAPSNSANLNLLLSRWRLLNDPLLAPALLH